MDEQHINRRDFLKRSARTGVAVAATVGAGFWLSSRSRHPDFKSAGAEIRSFLVDVQKPIPDMVIARGGTPAETTSAAIGALGGMETFVANGDIVVLKPNIGWDRIPQQAANTNPEVVKTVVEHCYAAGAKNVVVSDVSCNDARRCFHRSGIARLAESAGATVILPEDRKFRDFNMKGEILTVWPVFTPIIDADKVINLPIVKHHNFARATMGMKNWYGILGGRRNQLHQKIDVSIADLAAFIRPTLTIMDAYRVLMENGPQGGNLDDVKEFKTIIAGTDPVAIDAFGATFLGLSADQIPYIVLGHERRLGNKNYRELRIEEVSV